MKAYTITYYMREEHHDCGCEGHDHDHEHHHHHHVDETLIGEIKELGAWAHVLPTTFAVKTEKTPAEILEKLRAVIKPSDVILVSELTKETSACTTEQLIQWIDK